MEHERSIRSLSRFEPASAEQKSLWFAERTRGSSSLSNLSLRWWVSGPLDQIALERSLRELVARHEALRTSFSEIDGTLHQEIHRDIPSRIERIDARDLVQKSDPGVDELRAAARTEADSEARRPLRMRQTPLMRAAVIRIADSEHLLRLTLHQSVCDRRSTRNLLRELASVYASLRGGGRIGLVKPGLQYTDYVHWQEERAKRGGLEASLRFWQRRLEGVSPVLELPTDRARPPEWEPAGRTRSFRLDPGTAASLVACARRESATLWEAGLASLAYLLTRYGAEREVVVGSPIASQPRSDLESAIGLFTNTVPIRVRVDESESWLALLKRVRDEALEARQHCEMAFDAIVAALRVQRVVAHTPVFQVMFAVQDAGDWQLELSGATTVQLHHESDTARFDLALVLEERSDGIWVLVEYRTALFDEETVDRFADQYQALLASVVRDPGQRLREVNFLPAAQRRRFVETFNAAAGVTPTSDECIHEEIGRQAAATPDAVALVFRDEIVTYRELDMRSNQAAHALRRLGAGPEVCVALCLERSPDLVVALLAILKAGSAYVPLDPSLPSERLAYMIDDSRAPILVTVSDLEDRLRATDAHRVYVDVPDFCAAEPADRPASVSRPDHLAYVIYTSGSTGLPKGVMCTHRGVINLVEQTNAVCPVDEESRVLQFASINFDVSVWEILKTLAAGAVLVMAAPEERHPGRTLEALLRRQRVTHAAFPPTLLAFMDPGDLPCLRYLFVAGEPCPPEVYRRWSPGRTFFNAYGPTEATVCATVRRCENETGTLPIGRPAGGIATYVVDASVRLVPPCVPGELVIGGLGVARGYWRRPALTAERFVPDSLGGCPGQRLYRTGDWVRQRPDGDLEFIGRMDSQVKIRGLRIELGEIESAIHEISGVREAVVVACEDPHSGKRLVAYVVPVDGEKPEVATIREGLARRLPSYMLPSSIEMLESLPTNPSGKVDRAALPPPGELVVAHATDATPREQTERALKRVSANVLGVERGVTQSMDRIREVARRRRRAWWTSSPSGGRQPLERDEEED